MDSSAIDGLDSMERFQAITQEIAALKQQRTQVETLCRDSGATAQRLNKTVSILENASSKLQQWDEAIIRQSKMALDTADEVCYTGETTEAEGLEHDEDPLCVSGEHLP